VERVPAATGGFEREGERACYISVLATDRSRVSLLLVSHSKASFRRFYTLAHSVMILRASSISEFISRRLYDAKEFEGATKLQ